MSDDPNKKLALDADALAKQVSPIIKARLN